MEYREFTAKTVDEAITNACLELAVTSEKLEYTVVEAGSNGFLGIGRKDAVISARIKEDKPEVKKVKTEEKKEDIKIVKNEESVSKTEVKPAESNRPKIKTAEEIEAKALAAASKAGNTVHSESKKERRNNEGRDSRRENRDNKDNRGRRKYEEKEIVASVPRVEREIPKKTEEEIAQMINDADTFLTDVFDKMDIKVEKTINYEKETGYLSCNFEGDEMGIIIGKRGQTLDSLQYLTSLVVNKNQKDYVRVKLDTEEYRNRRKETLETLSKNIAYKVKKTRRSVALEPMNPYERRIIHAVLQNNKYVITYSEGEEPYRKVVIAYKKNR